MKEKICIVCGTSDGEFHGRLTWCKDCHAVKQRDSHLKRNYGIDLAEYNELLAKQGGVCAICSNAEVVQIGRRPTSLSVDHCHETGRIRGLLCSTCNKGIGCLGDTPEGLELALNYLKGT